MASTLTCRLKLGGRLAGPPEANTIPIEMFKRVMGVTPKKGGEESDKWPVGFLPTGMKVDHWIAEAAVGGWNQDETVLSFLAQVSMVAPVQLYNAREPFIRHFTRFLSYRDMAWYRDLRGQAIDLNISLTDKLIERVWFKGLSVFTDNGGDS